MAKIKYGKDYYDGSVKITIELNQHGEKFTHRVTTGGPVRDAEWGTVGGQVANHLCDALIRLFPPTNDAEIGNLLECVADTHDYVHEQCNDIFIDYNKRHDKTEE